MTYREISPGSFLCIAHKCIQCPEPPQDLSNTTFCPLLVGCHSFSRLCDFCLLMGHVICASCSWGFCCQVSLKNLFFIRPEPFLCVEILSFMGKRLNFNANSNSIPTYSHSLSIFSGSGSAPASDVSCTYLSWSYSSIFDEFLLPENLISLFDNVFFNVILLSLLNFHITLPSYTSFIFNIRVFFS